jgi:ribonuclease D
MQPVIDDQSEFDKLCEHIEQAGLVAFDTEFISEYTYQPELCLLQFATAKRWAAVDPFCVKHLDRWWELMADEKTTVVVHGGQAEVRFCLSACRRPPKKLVDVQIAEGLRSRSYPLGYQALVSRVIGKKVHGKETRSDWRRRPLSKEQIHYAVEDVKHLLAVWDRQKRSLAQRHRLAWAEAEFQRLVDELTAELTREGWRRLPGIHRLAPRELAVAAVLFQWRAEEAARRNKPARRILRDDLLLEVARRQPANMHELFATRDMNRTDYKRSADGLLECVQRGLAIPEEELPSRVPSGDNDRGQDEHVLGKLLAIALANRCAEMDVAMSLVGTSADLRQLVRWHVYGEKQGPHPRLTQGWRAEVCGDLLSDVLDGKVTLRVAEPDSDHPLVFERHPRRSSPRRHGDTETEEK